MEAHILGFPRIGIRRELKRVLEKYWKGTVSRAELVSVGNELKERHWRVQKESGLSFVAVGDFSFYDHVLDTVVMTGAVPRRFRHGRRNMDMMDSYFMLARGDAGGNIPPMEMTKWFDTNYHYIVPEFTPNTEFRPMSDKITGETKRAVALGYRPKPVLLGPITFVSLGKAFWGADKWSFIPQILDAYRHVLAELSKICDWIQIDEPILCTDIPPEARSAFPHAFRSLKEAAAGAKLLLATYFGELGDNLDLALESGCDALHIDLVRGGEQLGTVIRNLPENMILSAGLVDGRNIWKTDFRRTLAALREIEKVIGKHRMMIGSSCSLLHIPIDLELEPELDPEIKEWMAFAVQKCREIAILAEIMDGAERDSEMKENAKAMDSRRKSSRTRREDVRRRAGAVSPDMLCRKSQYPERRILQRDIFRRPLFPTTTIGSFPQTDEIRTARRRFGRGMMNTRDYEDFLKREIRTVIGKQEELGLDVLVHGEPERNDMVEYFGSQLEGFCITSNGWVQSYGSRCVKPPVIFGDVSRPRPMTVKWTAYARSLTRKPVKGIVTGPVTILSWSFVRDDLSRPEVCRQIALAIRDEVCDLEKAGVRIIQIDEAALREGLPLRRREHARYLRWAVDSFRLASSGVSDRTQIHTHMCYSEFNDIVSWIAEMDADVISIESSRSKMEILEAFREFDYPREIGPGVYDIHSPRVPSVEEIVKLVETALEVIPAERLWINPDCGLKTREWPETLASLRNMVTAARTLREKYPVEKQGDDRPRR